jgi:serine/threonine protein kinase
VIGKTVSHYKIISKLGEGGMGVVYKAEDTRLDRHVAIKFLPHQLSSDANAKKRFIREAKAASSLNHANIAVVHEIDETPEGQMFMVMACYEGQTLKDKLESGSLNVHEALEIVSQIASGLAKAHEKGILHRDIKPGNVLIGDDGQAKLADFGLATLAGQTKITKTGTTVGTVTYMSPEQASGSAVDQRSDVFSLGVVLYELVTGNTPFQADHEAAVLYGIMHSDPPPLSDYSHDVPDKLQHIIDRTLQKVAKERFGSAGEFLAALGELQASWSGLPPMARAYRRPRFRSRSLRTAGIAFVVVVVAAVVAVLSLQPRPAKPIESIAVLPLVDMSPDPAGEYFSAGMTEALILNLSKIRGLRVTSRTSVMNFKDTSEPLTSIARKLGVDGVVEGSVLKMGDRVQITAQLVDASSDATLWGESFESDARDVLQLQRQVARAVARGIELKLSPQEEVALAMADPIDPDAHAAYLQARFLWNQRSRESFPRSIELFEEALEKEPRRHPSEL